MKGLGAAISFLTIFPVPRGYRASMVHAPAWFPLVGLGLGGILAGLDYAAGLALPTLVVGALLLAALLVLTRALHTEGFLDSCDGLLGGFARERRLEIMRDPHVGAFAVIGCAALLLLKWSLLVAIPVGVRTFLLIVFPCFSRLGILSTMTLFRYAREEGMGAAFQAGGGWWRVAFGSATAVAAGTLLLGAAGPVMLSASVLVSLGFGWWSSRLLGGMTGDTYGATNEIGEVTVLLLAVVLYDAIPSLFEATFW